MKTRFRFRTEVMGKLFFPSRFACIGIRMPIESCWIALAAVAVLIVPLSLAGAQSAGSSNAISNTRGDAQNGRKLFVKVGCYGCHGREAQGGGLNGPRLAPDPIPIEAFLQFVRRPGGEMPPYTPKVISDKNLTDIFAFLLAVPQPPPVSSFPILKH